MPSAVGLWDGFADYISLSWTATVVVNKKFTYRTSSTYVVRITVNLEILASY